MWFFKEKEAKKQLNSEEYTKIWALIAEQSTKIEQLKAELSRIDMEMYNIKGKLMKRYKERTDENTPNPNAFTPLNPFTV